MPDLADRHRIAEELLSLMLNAELDELAAFDVCLGLCAMLATGMGIPLDVAVGSLAGRMGTAAALKHNAECEEQSASN